LELDYCLRPYITGRERVSKMYRPGAKILKVYKQLTEQDALTLTKMPDTREALLRWNASLRNIAALVRNNTSGDLQQMCVLIRRHLNIIIINAILHLQNYNTN